MCDAYDYEYNSNGIPLMGNEHNAYYAWKYNFKELQKKVDEAVFYLNNAIIKFNCLNVVVTGESGVAMATAIQSKLAFGLDTVSIRGASGEYDEVFFNKSKMIGINFINVRKRETETNGCLIEGRLNTQKSTKLDYIFLDDLIATGATIIRVKKEMKNANMLCVVLYDASVYSNEIVYNEEDYYEDFYSKSKHHKVTVLGRTSSVRRSNNDL